LLTVDRLLATTWFGDGQVVVLDLTVSHSSESAR